MSFVILTQYQRLETENAQLRALLKRALTPNAINRRAWLKAQLVTLNEIIPGLVTKAKQMKPGAEEALDRARLDRGRYSLELSQLLQAIANNNVT